MCRTRNTGNKSHNSSNVISDSSFPIIKSSVIPVSKTPVFERRQGLCHAGSEHYGAVTGRCQRREAALVTTIAKKTDHTLFPGIRNVDISCNDVIVELSKDACSSIIVSKHDRSKLEEK